MGARKKKEKGKEKRKRWESNFHLSSLAAAGATVAAGAPWRIDWKMKGGLGSGARWHRTLRLIFWTGACWVIYVHVPFAGPQEQISTVYFSELKAAGRQQFLYFWTLDKLNSARCKHTWQGGRLFFFYSTSSSPSFSCLPFPSSSIHPEDGESVIANIIDLSFHLLPLCRDTTWTFQLHGGLSDCDCSFTPAPITAGYLWRINNAPYIPKIQYYF